MRKIGVDHNIRQGSEEIVKGADVNGGVKYWEMLSNR